MPTTEPAASPAGLSLDHHRMAEALLDRKPVLRSKIAAACGVPETQVSEALCEVLRFLSLVAANGGGLTPSAGVDHAWHEFVLCTRLYAAWCERTLGRFVHHDPGGTPALNRERFARTLKLYTAAFGSPPKRWWGHSMSPAQPADCGACEGTVPSGPSQT